MTILVHHAIALDAHTTLIPGQGCTRRPGFQVDPDKKTSLLLPPAPAPVRGAPAISQPVPPFIPVGFLGLSIRRLGHLLIGMKTRHIC